MRQDDTTKESMTAKASESCDRALFEATVGDDGALPSGALPAVKAATEAGSKALLKALDEDGGNITKQAKRKNPKEKVNESEVVVPKTTAEPGLPMTALFLIPPTSHKLIHNFYNTLSKSDGSLSKDGVSCRLSKKGVSCLFF